MPGSTKVTTGNTSPQLVPYRSVLALIFVGAVLLVLYLVRAQLPISAWYALLTKPAQYLTTPLGDTADALNIPLLSALLFGLIGALAPCQLTTNASALAYVARGSGEQRLIVGRALAYLLGKALVYTIAGVAVILAGRQLAQQSIPVIVAARKVLGPLMIVLGLYLLGLLPLRFSVGHGVAGWLESKAGGGVSGAFLLGLAFSLAFCPTLFLLFFGWTIPMALQSPVGMVYPAVFAVGTTLPLLGLAWLFATGTGERKPYFAQARRLDSWLRPVTALVLLVAGLHDTVVYWFL